MGFSYLRRTPNEAFKQSVPFSFPDIPRYFADHVNYYGAKFEPIYVYSAGYDCNWPDRKIERTLQRIVFYYVVEGKCFFNGEAVEAGEMFFAMPNLRHTIKQDPTTPAKAWWVTLSGNNLHSFIKYCGFQPEPTIIPCSKIEKISSYIRDMVYESHFDVSFEAILLADLFHIIALQKYENSTYYQNRKIGNHYVSEALVYIEKHCTQRPTVEEIAHHIHVSPKYLTNIFSKYAGCSMRDFMINAKMRTARNLLEPENKLSVQEVSEILGYSDYYQFSRLFKKVYGVSPKEYRNRLVKS